MGKFFLFADKGEKIFKDFFFFIALPTGKNFQKGSLFPKKWQAARYWKWGIFYPQG